MRIIIVLFFACTMHTSALTSLAQNAKISLSAQKMKLEEILTHIESETRYRFAYSKDVIDVTKSYTIDVHDAGIEDVLDRLFGNGNISYNILDRQIVLSVPGLKAAPFAGQQQITISGRVTDSHGVPLPGVTVVIKDTTRGVITDADGNYSLANVQPDATIIFSFVGTRTQEIAVNGRSTIIAVMEEETIDIDEVVAVGYGVQRKSDLTGSTSRLTEDDLNKSIAKSPIEMMQGRISGVNIIQNSGEPGSGMTVQVRGSHSIRSGQTPLYVIDGVPLDNSELTPNGATATGIDQSAKKNTLTFLNSDDIESIDVLKDASATAIYGARGANGVVLITTKKGKKGTGAISYSGYVGIASISDKVDLLSASSFKSYETDNGSHLLDKGANTDWQDEVLRTAITHSHDISFGGGSENNTYRFSMGYVDEQGIIETTNLEKINGKAAFTRKAFNGRLDVAGSIIASHVKDRRAMIGETGGFAGDLIVNMLRLNPTYPVYNDDGSYFQYSTTHRNPVAMLHLTHDVTITDRIMGNISGDMEIITGLRYKLNIGLDRTVAERRVNQDKELNYLTNKGEADINSIQATNKMMEHYVTFMKNFGAAHKLNFLIGYSYQQFNLKKSSIHVDGFDVDDVRYSDNLNYGNYSSANVSSSASENELQSFFGRINYNLKDKYLFTFTGRFDGSTKFGKNNKYGFFPSGAFAWRLSEEDFFKDINMFTNLKIRLGWGRTGNQEIPNKISKVLVGTSSNTNSYFDETLVTGITFSRTPNPDIRWETSEQSNLGIDFGLFSNRFAGTVDMFYKKTKDVLLEMTAIAPAPSSRQWRNVPGLKIINKGIELGLNGVVIERKDLVLDLGVNLSVIDNKVKGLPATYIETGSASGQGLSGTRVQVIANDQPIGMFYGRVFTGYDSNGYNIYKTDNNGTEILAYLGSALPDFTYSFSAKLTHKKLDFSMFWYGLQGSKVYNNTANALFHKPALAGGSNVVKDVLNSPEAETNSTGYSSRFIENGSFLRLSNVSAGYTFNTRSISWIDKARIYVTGNNLLLITNYSGFDPEVNNNAGYNGIPSIGIDYAAYPKPRTFTLGVNLQF